MNPKPYPDEPWRRRTILVLSQQEFERCHYERDGGPLLLDEEAYVAVFPQSQGEAGLSELAARGLFQPGRKLVQSPFEPNEYEDAATAQTQFALAKYMHLSTVCMLLGASAVTVEQVDIRTAQGNTTFEVKGGNLQATGKVNVTTEELDRFRGAMTFEDRFEGGEADVNAAEAYLRGHGLWGDAAVRSLVEMFRAKGNRMLSRRIVVSLSSESSRNLTVAARLKVPAYVTLDATYARAVKTSAEFTVTINITFGRPVRAV